MDIDGALGDLKPLLSTTFHSVAGSLLTQRRKNLCPRSSSQPSGPPLAPLWETVGVVELSLRHQGPQGLDRLS